LSKPPYLQESVHRTEAFAITQERLADQSQRIWYLQALLAGFAAAKLGVDFIFLDTEEDDFSLCGQYGQDPDHEMTYVAVLVFADGYEVTIKRGNASEWCSTGHVAAAIFFIQSFALPLAPRQHKEIP